MGSGRWSTDSYTEAATLRSAKGVSAFHYSDTTRSAPRSAWKVHETLDPKHVGEAGHVRESRDSDEHPNSLAISVLFDVTGSMGGVPKKLQEKLPKLFNLLQLKGYVADPQILMGGIGDATCDLVPLQVGQFESDNRIDDNLGNIFLEAGGGAGISESYELAMYFMARHTALDCVEKRGHKGYLFLIGDEAFYPKVKASEVNKFIAVQDDELTEDISTAEIVKELQKKFEVFYIMPKGSSYFGGSTGTAILDQWRDLLGQNVLLLEDLDAVCETIALTIGVNEGTIDLEEGLDHLDDVGAGAAKGAVGRALATVGATTKGTVAVADTPTDLDKTDGAMGAAERL